MSGYRENFTKEELFKALRDETPEASWCKTCVKRDYCKIKEEVAFEENFLCYGVRKHIKVKAECMEYINDTKLKDIKNELLYDLGLRGRRL